MYYANGHDVYDKHRIFYNINEINVPIWFNPVSYLRSCRLRFMSAQVNFRIGVARRFQDGVIWE